MKQIPLASITPGKWYVEEGQHIVSVKYEHNGDFGYIACPVYARSDKSPHILTDENRANANVIAAVPEMLGVCIDIFLLAKEHNVRLPKAVLDNLQYALRKAGIYI